jgi:transketolase
LFDGYKEQFADRFLNCGVAEANMIGMAAGLAMSGLRPITYTITPFTTTRCFEQIRVDVCYHNVPVIITGVGGGLSYASLGATHHSCEDIALLRMLPHMTVICPGDAMEVRAALRAALRHDGPVYIRLGKKGEPLVHQDVPEFTIGKAIRLRRGSGACLLSTGNMLPVAIEAADILEAQGISTEVVSFHTIKPMDRDLLTTAFAQFNVVTTVEEHSRSGGLGGSIAEWLADNSPQRAALVRIGTPDEFLHEAGKQSYARQRFGLTAENIAEATRERLMKSELALDVTA